MAETPTTVWYTSKTLWVNAIALIAMVVQGVTGKIVVSLEVQATILAAINMVLRFITKQPVSWS